MPPDFITTVQTIAAILAAPLGGGGAIFVYLYFRERKKVDEVADARLADAKAYAKDLAEERQKRVDDAKACGVELQAERRLRVDDAKAYAKELAEERASRADDAEEFTTRILENQKRTIEGIAMLEAVIDAVGGPDVRRRLNR